MSPDPEEPETHPRGRVAAATERAKREAENARLWAEDARERSALVAFGFDYYERDRERYGGLLAGAVAFRLFLWLVPFALLLVGLLGAVTDLEDSAPDDLSGSLGLQGALAKTLSESAQQRGWWIAILLGLFGTVWAGMGVVRAHARQPLGRLGRPARSRAQRPRGVGPGLGRPPSACWC